MAESLPSETQSTTDLVSNVVNLTGLETGSPNPSSTDPFVFDISYNAALLPAIEQGLANDKAIYMVSPPGPDGGQYVNTVALNAGNIVTSPLDIRYGYIGAYAQFQADPLGGNGATPAGELGAWGIDIATHEVWAVVNHDRTFAVVATIPEPSTIVLAASRSCGCFTCGACETTSPDSRSSHPLLALRRGATKLSEIIAAG